MYESILKYKLKRYYRNHSREKNFLNLKDIHTILVLFDTAHFHETSVCIHQLKALGKEVTAYACRKRKDKQDYSGAGYHILSQKTTGKWFGNPVDTIAKELEQVTFDAVIDLTVHRNIPLEYLLAHTHASVKAGLKKNDFPQYDLSIIDLPKMETESLQVAELGKQILYYLDVIHTQ
ncbi:hypothetical protein FACS1894182_05100 [Bacteroidia bacterium]|nr:hypothetical protein FACS1894182_05100 [Bacteroidia bacterium]